MQMIIKFKCTYLQQIMQYLNKFTLSKNLNKFIKNVNKNKFDYTFSFSFSLVAMKILKKMTSMGRQISHFSLFLQSIFRNGVLFKHFSRRCCFCTYPTCKSQMGVAIQGRSGHVARAGGRTRLIGDFRLPHWKLQAHWRFEPAMVTSRRSSAAAQEQCSSVAMQCAGLQLEIANAIGNLR